MARKSGLALANTNWSQCKDSSPLSIYLIEEKPEAVDDGAGE